MQLNDFNEKQHSLKVLEVVILICLFYFLGLSQFVVLGSLMIMLIYFNYLGVLFLNLVKTLFMSAVVTLSYFLMVKLFSNHKLTEIKLINISLRIFCVSTISIASSYILNYEKILIYLMSHKKIPVRLGYPILLALNSIGLIKTEIEKININARYRQISILKRWNLLFPLLVFSIRHAERGALSLMTRGLVEDKSFLFYTEQNQKDKIIFYVIIFIHFVLVAIHFKVLK